MKKALLLLTLILSVSLCFSSCALGEFLATLGFDTHDYESEKLIREYVPDDEKAEELKEMVKILAVNSPRLQPFDGTMDAADKYRESVLNYMYNSNFAKYTGNPDLLDEATKIYPQMRFSVVIPGKDFVNVFYKYFGGKEKVTNMSCEMFEYLPKIDAYITAAQPQKNDVDVKVISLSETENTYRLKFSTSLDGEDGGSYSTIIIKRADGSCYFRSMNSLAN